MGKILILNGSPRAPHSNSKRYSGLFAKHCPAECTYANLTKKNHAELRARMDDCSDLLLVFPLYADALPVGLLNFLKFLEADPPLRRPVISVLINCGFLEYRQNETAVRMVRLFCRQNGYEFGSVLMLGGGEAILDTPFRFVAVRKIRRLARAVAAGRRVELHATMPVTKRMFIWASTRYWVGYGAKFGVSKAEMQTPEIES